MTSPYITGPAGPVVSVATAAALRAVDSNLFVDAQFSRILGVNTFEWDSTSTAVDDGATIIIPDDITHPAPGRWLVIAAGGTVTGTGTDRSIATWDAAGTGLRDNTNWKVDASDNFVGSGVNIDLDPSGTFDLAMSAGQVATVRISDALANAFLVVQGSDNYLAVDTTNGSEAMAYGNAVTNPTHGFLGGEVDIHGVKVRTTGVAVIPNDTAFAGRDNADAADVTLLKVTASDNIIFGSTSSPASMFFDVGASENINFRPNGGAVAFTFAGTTFTIPVTTMRFGTSVSAPVLQHQATTIASGEPFVSNAQDTSFAAGVGGARTDRAGDASGASGAIIGGAYLSRGGDAAGSSGTNVGGNWAARPGAGADGNGELSLQAGSGTAGVLIAADGGLALSSLGNMTFENQGAGIGFTLLSTIIDVGRAIFQFGTNIVTPSIIQADANSATDGDAMSMHNQDAPTGGVNKVCGVFLIRGANCGGASATNTAATLRLAPGLASGTGPVDGVFELQNAGGTNQIEIDSTGIGFYDVNPVAQPSSTGETAGFTGGAGAAVNDDSTFTGNVGSTAYRISDVVKHMKNLGLMAA